MLCLRAACTVQNGQTAFDGLYTGPTAISMGAHLRAYLCADEVSALLDCTRCAAPAVVCRDSAHMAHAQTSWTSCGA